jgi:hypothetical protein
MYQKIWVKCHSHSRESADFYFLLLRAMCTGRSGCCRYALFVSKALRERLVHSKEKWGSSALVFQDLECCIDRTAGDRREALIRIGVEAAHQGRCSCNTNDFRLAETSLLHSRKHNHLQARSFINWRLKCS